MMAPAKASGWASMPVRGVMYCRPQASSALASTGRPASMYSVRIAGAPSSAAAHHAEAGAVHQAVHVIERDAGRADAIDGQMAVGDLRAQPVGILAIAEQQQAANLARQFSEGHRAGCRGVCTVGRRRHRSGRTASGCPRGGNRSMAANSGPTGRMAAGMPGWRASTSSDCHSAPVSTRSEMRADGGGHAQGGGIDRVVQDGAAGAGGQQVGGDAEGRRSPANAARRSGARNPACRCCGRAGWGSAA